MSAGNGPSTTNFTFLAFFIKRSPISSPIDHVTLDINAFILCWKLDPVFPTYKVDASLSLILTRKQLKGFYAKDIEKIRAK